ncbi:hypothetical protein [Dyadobacter bucti]|uniref:hypothetical protein n=1 Tax=Dyadobacter bucti TaxID=2572203 RepID=UPI001109CF3D|nr:hypothetical protein [Dyadobacter bucti]
MNSSEQKDFEHHSPTKDEIEHTINLIYGKLALPQIHVSSNAAIKEGYEEAIEILTDGKRSYNQISKNLKTDQGKAIAVHAVDYLNGECTRKVLVGIPIADA